jgi:hypothetical protein
VKVELCVPRKHGGAFFIFRHKSKRCLTCQ